MCRAASSISSIVFSAPRLTRTVPSACATVGYQPMHVNFGLVPPLEDGKRRSKRDRYQAYADRALEALDAYLATRPDLFGGDRS